MDILKVNNLCKNYPKFSLKNVNFSLETGKITGFIGRNGAGKTTTLKSLLNFVHPDSGNIEFFGKNFVGNELEIKQKIGFVMGGIDYYSIKKIKTITSITKSFYDKWDDDAYKSYMELFKLDENKTPRELSEGMKVKYSLALAMSHNAELLMLDEPTSGLDPLSRDELLDIFMDLCDKGVTILFSTHITSDLDKCASNIIYIKKGEIIADTNIKTFIDTYRVMQISEAGMTDELKSKVIGFRRNRDGFSALINKNDEKLFDFECKVPDLEEIMVHLEKED